MELSEGAPAAQTYDRKPIFPQILTEQLSRGDEIYREPSGLRIFYPENPLVPSSEGIHLRIESPGVPVHPKTPDEWRGWLRHWAIMIGAGKVVSEGAALFDMWQSFVGQNEYSPSDHLVTELIGRSPLGESWGQTAPFPASGYDHTQSRLGPEHMEKFRQTLNRYFRAAWLPAVTQTKTFENLPQPYLPETEEYQAVYQRNTTLAWPWQSEPVFVSDTIEVVGILVPHLKSGIHFLVGIHGAPKRPWQNLARTLESLAAGEVTAQILSPLAAWTSVRATGSWFGGFQTLPAATAYKDSLYVSPEGDLSVKGVKRHFRGAATRAGPGSEWSMGIGFHPHVYGARHPDEAIRLTKRPATEKGVDWQGIKPMNVEELDSVREQHYTGFITRLKAAQGSLYVSNSYNHRAG